MPPDSPSTAHALEAGERARLVREHFDYVWRLLRRLGLPEADADDAAQEVFLVGLSKWRSIESGRERAFLYGCALNKAAQFRAARPQRHEELSPHLQDDRALSAEDLVDRKRAQHVLDRVLDRLNDDQRVVFVLYEIEELTLHEIAELLQIPSGTAASRLRLARARVQNLVMMLELDAPLQSGEHSSSNRDDARLSALGEGTP